MLIVIDSLAPPTADTVEVLVAASDISPGRRITAQDVTTVSIPADVVHPQTLTDPTAAEGRIAMTALVAGEWLTRTRLLAEMSPAGSGMAAMPISLADEAVIDLLRPGSLIDVLWAPRREGEGEPRVVARRLRVLTLPSPGGDDPFVGQSSRGLVVVEVDDADALALAEAGASGSLSVLLHHG